ncbi:MAG TPA: S-adenosylmethionine:tRNA ribosyltransferase-isomerase [Polyangia bacterium]
MRAARSYPARRDDVRLLVVDASRGSVRESRTTYLPALLSAGDLLIVNDAATIPASLSGRTAAGEPVEARLIAEDLERAAGHFWAVLLGAGDWRQRTEDRPPPPAVGAGDRLRFGRLDLEVVALSPLSRRLVALRFPTGPERPDAVWAALYREGRPVQYSYLAHELPLWAVQTVYAGRPWAFEMPSAGRPLSWEILLALRDAGVHWASLTHAAGLSSTGDAVLDAALPLPERFEIPAATVAAIEDTRRRGGRVIAVGTTVVRALEGRAAAAPDGVLRPGASVTDLRIGPAHRRRVVDGILSGIHTSAESHFALLAAFAPLELLEAAERTAEARDFSAHELGDAMLILGRPASPVAPVVSAGPPG